MLGIVMVIVTRCIIQQYTVASSSTYKNWVCISFNVLWFLIYVYNCLESNSISCTLSRKNSNADWPECKL